MTNTHRLALIALFTLTCPALTATAASVENAEDLPDQSIESGSLQQIPATRKALEAAKAGEYGKLRAEDQQQLDAADREISLLTHKHDDLAKLDAQERMRLFNAQETVMAIVSGLKRNQLVCTYRANAGTRFKTKHCMTRDMADATRKSGRETTLGAQTLMCVPGEGSTCTK
jgi:hypothetical protein